MKANTGAQRLSTEKETFSARIFVRNHAQKQRESRGVVR
jgi:hypothetical protein